MRAWVGVGLVLALAGCAENPPSRSYLAMSGMLEASKMQAEYRGDLHSADFAPIQDKVDLAESFETGLPACEESRLDGYPTPAEQTALRRWQELRTAYLIGLDALQTRPGRSALITAPAAWRYSAILTEARGRSTQLISDLADGKLTYCQFATRDRAQPYVDARREQPYPPDMNAILMANESAEHAGSTTYAPSIGPAPAKSPSATTIIQNSIETAPTSTNRHY